MLMIFGIIIVIVVSIFLIAVIINFFSLLSDSITDSLAKKIEERKDDY